MDVFAICSLPPPSKITSRMRLKITRPQELQTNKVLSSEHFGPAEDHRLKRLMYLSFPKHLSRSLSLSLYITFTFLGLVPVAA